MTILEDGEVYNGAARKMQQARSNQPYIGTHGPGPQQSSSSSGFGVGSASPGPVHTSPYGDSTSGMLSTDNLLHYNVRESPPSRAFEASPRRERGESPPNRSGLISIISWHLRGGKARLLLLVASVSVLILLHDHVSDAHRFHRDPWRDQRPFQHPPPPPPTGPPPNVPPLPPPPDANGAEVVPNVPPPSKYHPPVAKPDTDVPIMDSAQFVQLRTPLRPSDPNPWSDLPHSWQGHKLLSPKRFGTGAVLEYGTQGTSDPPKRSFPPARYLTKAMEFAAAAGRRMARKDYSWRVIKFRTPPKFDEMTGRPLMVPHDEVFVTQDGWQPPEGIKVSDLKGREQMPRVQAATVENGDFNSEEREMQESQRREWVKRAFLHAWEGYKEHAWGHDELKPTSNLFSNGYNGWGATIVDNLDTLLMMNLSHEYNLARDHVAAIDFTYLVPSGERTFSTELPDLKNLDLPDGGELPDKERTITGSRYTQSISQHSPTTIPHFETTIRYLGGMLAAYEISGDPLMLERATELGDWLLPSLGTRYGLAINRYALGSNPGGLPSGRVTLAEVGSLTLEFTKLSMLTGNEIYYQAVQRSMDTLDKQFTPPKARTDPTLPIEGRLGTLLPAYIDPGNPTALFGDYTFGGLADSYYEYLIKQAQLMSNAHSQYSRMYASAIDTAEEFLIKPVEVVPGREDLSVFGTWRQNRFTPVLEHLTCFGGGMLSLGSRLLNREKDLQVGINVTEACAWAYESNPTGLGPERLTFYLPDEVQRYHVVTLQDGTKARRPRGNPVIGVRNSEARYIGRPETIESVFYQWRITGDRKWQDQGWRMFTSWMEHAITEAGFATVGAVNTDKPRQEDSMESFVLAESLKYYYLLFSPRDFFSLDDWVFNTEAHPFHIPKKGTSAQDLPQSLWTGPDSSSTPVNSFVEGGKEGTWVQQWARIGQAAGLLRIMRDETQSTPKDKPVGNGALPADVAARPFVRPSDEELKAAGANPKDLEQAAAAPDTGRFAKAPERPKNVFGGGGRGMGGGWHPEVRPEIPG